MLSWLAHVAPARHHRYLLWAKGDSTLSQKLYLLNLQVAESLYIPLHTLEILVRNVTEKQLALAYGATWFTNSSFKKVLQKEQLDQLNEVMKRHGNCGNNDKIVSEFNFSFWTSMYASPYNNLWIKTLRNGFPYNKSLKRREIAGRLNDLRKLRNRIAHFEPILQLDLIDMHAKTLEICGWMEPTCIPWLRSSSRFNQVHPVFKVINLVSGIEEYDPKLRQLPMFK